MRQVTTLIVDDSAYMREALLDMLQTVPGCVVVGEAVNGLDAIELACALRPRLVVMDVHMPIMGGLDAARRMTEKLPDAVIVMMSTVTEAEIRTAAMRSGAAAYFEKGRELWLGLPNIVSELLQSKVATGSRP